LKLAEILRELLDSAALSERELSRRIGVPQPVINRLLKGIVTNPALDTLKKIASYFNITVSELTGEVPMSSKLVEMAVDHKGWEHVPVYEANDIIEYLKSSKLPQPVQHIPIDVELQKGSFAYKLHDGSMEPLFSSGDIVVIDPTKQDFANRKYVLVASNDVLSVRECVTKNGKHYLKSYRPLKLDPIDSQKLVGIVAQSKKYFQI